MPDWIRSGPVMSVGAKAFLSQRHAARRQIPFTPLACFDLPFDEAQNGLRLRSDGPEPLPSTGVDDFRTHHL